MPTRIAAVLLAMSTLQAWPVNAGQQSALARQGDHAARIAEMSWVMFIGGGIIFTLVMTLLAAAFFGPPAVRTALSRHSLIIGAGVLFPIVTLSALLVYTLWSASALARSGDEPAVRVDVIGEMWWWRVRYIDKDGKLLMETANEIRIPVGRPVEFRLTSPNVIHSFWVPNLAGKIDMIPGHVNTLRIRAEVPGTYRGQCAEYCGAQHANMAFFVVAQTPEEYGAWLAGQQLPAPEPRDAELATGKRHFMQLCAQCHTVRGTTANGTIGPDLTHAGGRLSLAAGMLPNNAGALAGWIAGSQHIKPDNKMPSFNTLSGEELRAVVAYVESLE